MSRKRKARSHLPATVDVVEIDGTVGCCEWAHPRRIWVSSRQSEIEQFSTLHHEWLHRIFPDMKEPSVLRLEKDFADAVKKFFVVKRRKARKRRKKA